MYKVTHIENADELLKAVRRHKEAGITHEISIPPDEVELTIDEYGKPKLSLDDPNYDISGVDPIYFMRVMCHKVGVSFISKDEQIT